MAKVIKTYKKIKNDAVNVIKDRLNLFKNVYSSLYHLFDEEVEHVFMILCSGGEVVDVKEISKVGTSTGSSVEVDYDIVEEVLEVADTCGYSFALAHNHPYVTDADGNWVETLISHGDVVTTNTIVSGAFKLAEDVEYIGHFVVNKEDGDERKIIFFDQGDARVKYSMEVIDKIEKGEL